jgi:hypothetical protein
MTEKKMKKETKVTEKSKTKEEAAPQTEDEALAQLQDAIDKMHVKDLAYNMMMNMASTAYKKMGLPVEQNAKYKDLAQAKLAIDCLDGLLKAAAASLEDQDSDAFCQTLANLQMTYAQQS